MLNITSLANQGASAYEEKRGGGDMQPPGVNYKKPTSMNPASLVQLNQTLPVLVPNKPYKLDSLKTALL